MSARPDLCGGHHASDVPTAIDSLAPPGGYNRRKGLFAGSAFMLVLFWILGAFGYLGSPAILIWGWTRWLKQPKLRTIPAILSLISFVLATASALLAISSIAVAQVHHFPYYDPLLLTIFRWGALLSLGGIAFGIGGVWRRSSLRWHAPVSAVSTLAFWLVSISGE